MLAALAFYEGGQCALLVVALLLFLVFLLLLALHHAPARIQNLLTRHLELNTVHLS